MLLKTVIKRIFLYNEGLGSLKSFLSTCPHSHCDSRAQNTSHFFRFRHTVKERKATDFDFLSFLTSEFLLCITGLSKETDKPSIFLSLLVLGIHSLVKEWLSSHIIKVLWWVSPGPGVCPDMVSVQHLLSVIILTLATRLVAVCTGSTHRGIHWHA